MASGPGFVFRLRPALLAPEALFLVGLAVAASFCFLGMLLPACEHGHSAASCPGAAGPFPEYHKNEGLSKILRHICESYGA